MKRIKKLTETNNKNKQIANFKRRKCKSSVGGFLTFQFLIALMISMFFIISFLGLVLTLAHSSLTQYLTYSAARKTALGGLTAGDQEAGGEEKYTELRQLFFKNSFQGGGGGWFVIAPDTTIGFNTDYSAQEDSRGSGSRYLFYGSFVEFQSNITNFQIPGLSTKASGDLKTTVGSYLGREPSQEECTEYFRGSKSAFPFSVYKDPLGGRLILTDFFSDNGC